MSVEGIDFLNECKEFTEVKEVYSEYEVLIGYQSIGIKIFREVGGTFGYEVSHHYHGAKQGGPYQSSLCTQHKDEETALLHAQMEITSFYRQDGGTGKWVKNEDYNL